jgi:hypothetical protein
MGEFLINSTIPQQRQCIAVRDQWWAFVDTVTNILVSLNATNLSSILSNIN